MQTLAERRRNKSFRDVLDGLVRSNYRSSQDPDKWVAAFVSGKHFTPDEVEYLRETAYSRWQAWQQNSLT